MSTSQDDELQELLFSDAYSFLAECGVNIVTAGKDDLPRIRNAIIKALCIYSCKAQLDEIVRGLDSVNIGPMLRSHPKQFLPLFLDPPKPLTPGMLQDLFTLDLSDEGSNKRDAEEETALFWVNFLFELGEASPTFQDDSAQAPPYSIILNFVTGSTEVPTTGFVPTPTVNFSMTTRYPIASTCSNCLTLPLGLQYEEFRHNMAFGIKNSPGFQRL